MRLMRTSEVTQRPVVTMAGEDIAQIKDVVYAADGGSVIGFTLAGRGLFAGPLKEGLPWEGVSALGADAVMVRDESVLVSAPSIVEASRGSAGSAGDVLGSQVLTEEGIGLGTVRDVVVSVDVTGGEQCDVVGYEVEASEGLGTQGQMVLIPLPDTMAASGEHLMVPSSVKDFVGHDLAGFGAAVDRFRSHLTESRP
ncbi:PRC-barrel domain containing protein [Nostocoides sp. F2B08]|nr:PRC-barrel domain containing protein [Tetrasphaera sp. F2B08]